MVFDCFSTFFEWELRDRSGLALVVHYLDKFLFARPGGPKQCAFLLNAFIIFTQKLGFSLAGDKTEGPVQCPQF